MDLMALGFEPSQHCFTLSILQAFSSSNPCEECPDRAALLIGSCWQARLIHDASHSFFSHCPGVYMKQTVLVRSVSPLSKRVHRNTTPKRHWTSPRFRCITGALCGEVHRNFCLSMRRFQTLFSVQGSKGALQGPEPTGPGALRLWHV